MKNTSKKLFISAAALGISLACTNAIAAEPEMEKCYGVVKAGKNDCSSAKKGSHSCAGEAKTNGDKSEWILLAKGTCERLVNGSLKAGN